MLAYPMELLCFVSMISISFSLNKNVFYMTTFIKNAELRSPLITQLRPLTFYAWEKIRNNFKNRFIILEIIVSIGMSNTVLRKYHMFTSLKLFREVFKVFPIICWHFFHNNNSFEWISCTYKV